MAWLVLAVVSYLLSGTAALIDKILLKNRVPDPIVLVFYTGILSLGVFVFAPFGFTIPDAKVLSMALAAGTVSLVGLYFFYRALTVNDTSRVVPILSAFIPLFIILLIYARTGKFPGALELKTFSLFIFGSIFLGLEKPKIRNAFHVKMVFLTLLAAFFFAVYFYLLKIIFDSLPFFPGLIWSRSGAFLGGVLLFFIPRVRKKIFTLSSRAPQGSFRLVVANKIAGGLGLIALSYAIKLGPVGIINSLRGLENVFILIAALLLTIFAPRVLRESIDTQSLILKIFGIFLIGVGFLFLCQTGTCDATF